MITYEIFDDGSFVAIQKSMSASENVVFRFGPVAKSLRDLFREGFRLEVSGFLSLRYMNSILPTKEDIGEPLIHVTRIHDTALYTVITRGVGAVHQYRPNYDVFQNERRVKIRLTNGKLTYRVASVPFSKLVSEISWVGFLQNKSIDLLPYRGPSVVTTKRRDDERDGIRISVADYQKNQSLKAENKRLAEQVEKLTEMLAQLPKEQEEKEAPQAIDPWELLFAQYPKKRQTLDSLMIDNRSLREALIQSVSSKY